MGDTSTRSPSISKIQYKHLSIKRENMGKQEFANTPKSARLHKKEFAALAGVNYNAVVNWNKLGHTPAWVDSWLKYYQKAQQYDVLVAALRPLGGALRLLWRSSGDDSRRHTLASITYKIRLTASLPQGVIARSLGACICFNCARSP